jgi:hypothetical protein
MARVRVLPLATGAAGAVVGAAGAGGGTQAGNRLPAERAATPVPANLRKSRLVNFFVRDIVILLSENEQVTKGFLKSHLKSCRAHHLLATTKTQEITDSLQRRLPCRQTAETVAMLYPATIEYNVNTLSGQETDPLR